MDLLPDDISEFRSESYWTEFFRKRGNLPFEWYGEWSELKQLVDRFCAVDDSILMVGCGNSELSGSMYDSGYLNLTNIDFSKPVIADMMKKNLRQRPKMRWKVMDMTAMTFESDSFNVVVDKGGLDALMGEPGQEGEVAGAKLLHEVKRVLKSDIGRYFCVTLAQDYVADVLITTFRHGWDVALHRMPQPGDGAPSALQPFVFVATRSPPSEPGHQKLSPVTMAFDRISSGSMDAAQTAVLCEAVEAENEFRRSANTAIPSESVGVEWRDVVEGRREECQLGGSAESARYSAVVLDAKAEMGAVEHECAVFLVPQGREHEWLFGAEGGQWQLLESAKAKRLILIRMNRGHQFGSMESVQTELSPLVLKLAPQNCTNRGTLIPYMTTGDGLGSRTVVEVVHSPLTGRMEIEDVQLESDAETDKPPTWRRLFFSRNIGLVQSEALLVYPLQGGGGDGVRKPRRKGGKREKERQAAKLAAAASEKEMESSLAGGARIEYSHLACGYHVGVVAGLALIEPQMAKRLREGREVAAMVVGLGGGALPMFLHNHLPFSRIQVVELDPVVGQVARCHFGFRTGPRLQLTIGDGIAAVEAMAGDRGGSPVDQSQGVADAKADAKEEGEEEEASRKEGKERRRIQVLVIDADSDDTTTGMSCPPAAFLEPSFLHSASSTLLDEGMLVVNVVSRAQEPYRAAVAALQMIFAEVYEMDVDEDVNRLLFALPTKCSIDTSDGGLLAAATNLVSLARQHGPWRQGPNIEEYTSRVKLLPR